MKNSRTINAIRNMSVSGISQVITLLMSFISRSIFIYTLGTEYLGINGLFTNILTVLSFAELGIGNAIIFSMYKPLANKDKQKLTALMNLYKNAYKLIGVVIAIIGLLIIPFLPYIIKDTPQIKENLVFIYVLFLANTVISYFFVYKSAIISADQQGYIVTSYQQIFRVIQSILQISILIISHNYILYLLIQIITTFLANYFIAHKADKMYPYLNEKNDIELSKKEKMLIFKNVKALFLYKFGSVILTGTDNIIISAFVGVESVGLSSNYTLIITSITNVINQALTAITASIGNLNAIESTKKKEDIFNQLFFISTWIYSFCSVGLLLFIEPFMKLWIGEEYILSKGVLFSLVLTFYIVGVQFAAFTYRTTMGLFVQSKYSPIIAAILNIIISIYLSKYLGLAGIFLATSISRALTLCWIDPYYIYKLKFKTSSKKYFGKYFIYLIITFLTYLTFKFIFSLINLNGWSGLFTKAVIFTVLCNGLYILLSFRTVEFKGIYNILKPFIYKVKKLMK